MAAFSVPVILAIILCVVFVVLIVLGLIFSSRGIRPSVTETEIEEFLSQVDNLGGFTPPVPVSGERGNCYVYTFPSQPILSTELIDGLTPQPIRNVDCLDDDQLALQKTETTCTRTDFCQAPDGTRVGPSEKFVSYSVCGQALIDSCWRENSSSLSLIGLNFQPPTLDRPASATCLTYPSPISVSPCNPDNKSQLIRVTRAQAVSLVPNSSGPYARLVNRANGRCLIPSRFPPLPETSLIEGECSPNSGYLWWLIPPLSLTIIRDGQNVSVTSPQQIVFTSTVSSPPRNLTDYFSNPSNSSLSIQFDSQSRAVLRPFVRDSASPEGVRAQTQIFELSLYSYLTSLPRNSSGTNIPF